MKVTSEYRIRKQTDLTPMIKGAVYDLLETIHTGIKIGGFSLGAGVIDGHNNDTSMYTALVLGAASGAIDGIVESTPALNIIDQKKKAFMTLTGYEKLSNNIYFSSGKESPPIPQKFKNQKNGEFLKAGKQTAKTGAINTAAYFVGKPIGMMLQYL